MNSDGAPEILQHQLCGYTTLTKNQIDAGDAGAAKVNGAVTVPVCNVPGAHVGSRYLVHGDLEVLLRTIDRSPGAMRISFLLTSMKPKLWPVGQPTG